MNFRKFSFFVSASEAGCRLDVCVANKSSCSRATVVDSIRSGNIYVDEVKKKPSYVLSRGECVRVFLREKSLDLDIIPEDIMLNDVYEDSDILVINKEADIVVHPSPGHFSGTVVNAILARYPGLNTTFGLTFRPGIVHRLDKDTTGLLVIAKTLDAFQDLLFQFKTRAVLKYYMAIVYGVPNKETGIINYSIGRGRSNRKKMSIRSLKPKTAETRWRVIEKYGNFMSLLELDIKTGRTHQIRLHCKSIGHPIVGDQMYGKRIPKIFRNQKDIKTELKQLIRKTKRQMLHAYKINFLHPSYRKKINLETNLPPDMAKLVSMLSDEFDKKISYSLL